MKIRLVGGGLAAVLAVGVVSATSQAATNAYFQENFNSYSPGTTTGYNAYDSIAGNTIYYFTTGSANFITSGLPNQLASQPSSNFKQSLPNPSSTYALGNWYGYTASTSAIIPRYTLGYYKPYSPTNTSGPGFQYVSNDESPFSGVSGGYGLDNTDPYTNNGNQQRVGVSWNVNTNTGAYGSGTGHVITSFDFVMHDTPATTSTNANFTGPGNATNSTADDNMAVYMRLFDSTHTTAGLDNGYSGIDNKSIQTSNQSGFFLLFTDPVGDNDAGFVASYYNSGNLTGLTTSSGSATQTSFNYETWYHVVIDMNVTGVSATNRATVTIQEYSALGDSPVQTFYQVNTSNSSLTYHDNTNSGLTTLVDSLQWGSQSGPTSIGSFGIDNISVVPEPATLGLLTLATTMLLPRRRQRA